MASITVTDYSLEKLSHMQRIVFLTITIILVAIALVGNIATIVFNLRRYCVRSSLLKEKSILLFISDKYARYSNPVWSH